MRKTRFAPNEYYHIFSRGNNKQKIFFNEKDYIRLIFLILHFQAPTPFYNPGRQVNYFTKHHTFNISNNAMQNIVKMRIVDVVNFCIMPNHFHLTLRERANKGISQYMQRVLDACGRYTNAKYQRSGHVFEGPFHGIHIKNNEQLLHLSAYIHRNPREIKAWKNRENKYPWSSYQDYVKENRWGNLLKQEIINRQFSGKKEYHNFIKSSSTKNLDEEHHL